MYYLFILAYKVNLRALALGGLPTGARAVGPGASHERIQTRNNLGDLLSN